MGKKKKLERGHGVPKYRKLTRFEKSCCIKQGFNPDDYIFAYDLNDGSCYFKIKNRFTGIEATVNKFKRAKHKWDY